MDDGSNPAWSSAEQFGHVDPDFGNLLDFDNLDLDFPVDFHNSGLNEHDSAQQLTTELAQSLDAQHLHNPFSPHILSNNHHNDGAGAQQHQQHQQHQQGVTGSGMSQPGHSNTFFEFSMSQFSANQMYRPRPGVPPTPNSTEMHADPAQYLQQMQAQGLMFDHDFHMRKEDVRLRRTFYRTLPQTNTMCSHSRRWCPPPSLPTRTALIFLISLLRPAPTSAL
jgi:hypothetical protein